MEKLNAIKMSFITIIGAIGSFIANQLGGWTEDMTTLVIFMGVDFSLGLTIAAFFKKSNKSENGSLSSWSAWKGICKKGVSLLVILVAYRLDITLGTNYIKTAAVIAFIVNEAISIVENLGIMGIKFPAVITKAIDILQQKSEKEGE